MGKDTGILVIGILGNITAILLFASPLLTVWRIVRKRSVEDFSGLPFVGVFANCFMWTFYGLPLVTDDNLLIITINGAGAVLSFVFVLIFLIFSSGMEKRKVGVLFLAVIILWGVFFAICLTAVPRRLRKEVVGAFALAINCVMFATFLANTRLVLKTRSVDYLPLSTTFIPLASSLVWTVYGALASDVFIMVPNALGVLLSLFNIALFFAFYDAWKANTSSAKGDMELSAPAEVAVQLGTSVASTSAANGSPTEPRVSSTLV